MASNYGGLGFSFRGIDDGLTKLQSTVQKGFEAMAKSVDVLQMQQQQMTKTMGQVSDSLDELGQRAQENLEKKLPGGMNESRDTVEKDGKVIMKTQAGMSEGFSSIGKSVELLKKILSQAKFQTLIQAMGFDKLRDLARQVGGGFKDAINITDSWENSIVSASKSSAALGSKMGYTGAALRKFKGESFGLADSLNVGVDTAGLAIRAFDEMDKGVLKATGLTKKSLAQMAESWGVSSDLIRNSTLRMTNEFGMSGEQVDAQLDAFYNLGAAVGDTTLGFNAFQKSLERQAQMKALGYTADEIERFNRGTASLGVGLFKTMQNSDEAAATMNQLADTLVNTQKDFSKMFSGIEKGAPQAFTELSIMTADAGTSIEMLGKSPDDFIIGMSKMVQAQGGWDAMMEKNSHGAMFLRDHMEQIFGEAAPQLIGMMNKLDDATIKQMEATKTNRVELSKLADEAHETGRTLEEKLSRATERLHYSFNRISRSQVREFVSETNKEYKKFGKTVGDIAAAGGPLGAFVKKASEVRQLGALGFIPKEFRATAMLAGEATQAVVPMAAQLQALGVPVSKLLTPVGALTMGVGAVALAFRKAEKDFIGTTDALAGSDKLMKKEKNSIQDLQKRLGGLQQGTEEYNLVKQALEKKTYQVTMAERLKDAKSEQERDNIRAAIAAKAREDSRATVQNMAQNATETVATFLKALPDLIKGVVTTLKAEVKGGLLSDVFKGLGDVALAAFEGLKTVAPLAGKALVTLVDGAFEFLQAVDFSGAINTVIGVAKNVLEKAFEIIGAINWSGVFETVFGAIKTAATTIIGFLGEIDWGLIANTLASLVGTALNTAWDILSSVDWGGIIGGTVDLLTGIVYKSFDFLANMNWAGAFQLLFDGFARAMDALTSGGGGESLTLKLITLIGVAIQGAFKVAGAIIKGAAEAWWNNFTELFDPTSGEGIGGKVGRALMAGLTGALVLSGTFRKKFIGMFASIIPKIFGPMKSAIETLRHPFASIASFFGDRLRAEVAAATGKMPAAAAPAMMGKSASGAFEAVQKTAPLTKGQKVKAGIKKHAGKAAMLGGLALSMGAGEGGIGETVGDIALYGGLAAQAASAFGITGASIGAAAASLGGFAATAARAVPVLGAVVTGGLAVYEAGKRISAGWDEASGAGEKAELVLAASAAGIGGAFLSMGQGVMSVATGITDGLGLTTGAAEKMSHGFELAGNAMDHLLGLESDLDRRLKAQQQQFEQNTLAARNLGVAISQTLTASVEGLNEAIAQGGEGGLSNTFESIRMTTELSAKTQGYIGTLKAANSVLQLGSAEFGANAVEQAVALQRSKEILSQSDLPQYMKDAAMQAKNFGDMQNVILGMQYDQAKLIAQAHGMQVELPKTQEELFELQKSNNGEYQRMLKLIGDINAASGEGAKERSKAEEQLAGMDSDREKALENIASLEEKLKSGTLKGADRDAAVQMLEKQRAALSGSVESYKGLLEEMVSQKAIDPKRAQEMIEAAEKAAASAGGAEGGAQRISTLVEKSDQLSGKDLVKDLQSQISQAGGFGAAMRQGLLPTPEEIDKAMLQVGKAGKKELEAYKKKLLEEQAAYEKQMQAATDSAVVRLQNMGFTGISDAVARDLVENKSTIVDAWNEVIGNLGGFADQALGKEGANQVENLLGLGGLEQVAKMKGTMSADEYAAYQEKLKERDRFRQQVEEEGLTSALQSNAEYLQQLQTLYKENPVQVSTQMGIQPITAEEFLAAYAQADTPEAKEKLKERLGITALLDPEQAAKVQEALATIPGDLTEQQSKQMQEAADNLKNYFTDASTAAKESIQSVMTTAEEVHGNSVNTVIIADFEKATAGIETEADKIRKVIEALGIDVASQFRMMWDEVLDYTGQATDAIYSDALAAMGQLTATAAAAADAANMTEEGGTVGPVSEVDLAGAETDTVMAIHNPAWYKNYQENHLVFIKEYLRAIAANTASMGGGGTGRPGASKTLLSRPKPKSAMG